MRSADCRQDEGDADQQRPDAELVHSGRLSAIELIGISATHPVRRILAALAADVRAAGVFRMVLETGIKQPEALELYASSGYVRVEKFAP
ncbi:hypothetical protein [Streptomyces sioyaensis]|uniref:hypothetical protein n=1 Tax=Streptomyces sioyaensis TaxID=67364 RepID=UPI0037B4407C